LEVVSMIRQLLKLAVDAAKVEYGRWRNPGTATEPEQAPELEPEAPPPVPATPPASKWTSTAYHTQVLASTECPFCNGAKSVGAYMCKPCIGTKGVQHVA